MSFTPSPWRGPCRTGHLHCAGQRSKHFLNPEGVGAGARPPFRRQIFHREPREIREP